MMHVSLGRIVGEHKVIERLRGELKIAFSQQTAAHFTQEGLRLMAMYQPLWVTPDGDNFRCIGMSRYFHILKAGLPATAEIPVIVHDRVSKKKIEELFRLEILLVPEVYLLTGNDRRHMGWQWQHESNTAFLTKTVKKPNLKTLAQMLCREERTLKGAKDDANKRTKRKPSTPKAA